MMDTTRCMTKHWMMFSMGDIQTRERIVDSELWSVKMEQNGNEDYGISEV